MVASKFLNPRNDLAFKRIFGSERNKDILIHFLNDILDREFPIKKVTFLKTVQDPEIAPLRVSVVDVMCEDQDHNRFIIEMQLSHEKGFDRRALYYAARAYCSQRTEKKRFHDLKDVYFLAITDFTPFPNKKTWLSKIGLKDLETNEHDIDAIQLLFMQLPLFKKTKKDLKKMALREKWAYFFKYADETTEEDLKTLTGKDQIIKRAYEELDRFSWSEKELNNYESIEMKKAADEAVKEAAFAKGIAKGIEQGIEKGIEQGIAKGIGQGKREIALKMLRRKRPLKEIEEDTGLSLKEIESLHLTCKSHSEVT